MSENQNIRNIYKKEYAGFFTEDSIDNLDDVINIMGLMATLFCELDGKSPVTFQSKEMASITNVLYRELCAAKSGMHFSGGIFSWHKAEAAGIARNKK
ncbi:hypothetical protein [Escherichia coli]|uniref:hypothetical protein n=1 Tax=Escherichia coli TaxID=562 RepID=UPI0013753DE3|nr:hypothetical protein [Escherichia coli]QHR35554.1 hypothetical protein FNE83_07570 [Escherichia coli]HAO9529441.1 hypothetical protein [Escherichia coli]HAU9270012.1 hypothetical protein [Escherichia coli]HAU9372382.1 hypothetical protein [Escherichia coli]HDX4251625.1 hypothetical protein [Escherichia coli]